MANNFDENGYNHDFDGIEKNCQNESRPYVNPTSNANRENAVNQSPSGEITDVREPFEIENNKNKKNIFYDIFIGHKTKAEIVSDILLVFTILLVAITSFVWFATPTTEIGGITYAGKTQNIYSFLYGNENSLFNQMKTAVETFSSADISGDEAVGAISLVMKFVRLILLAVPAIIVGIKIIIDLILTPIYLKKKNFYGLRKIAISSVVRNLIVYIFFVFYGSVSGGVGVDSYFIGYTAGAGMTVGILIAIATVLTCSIILYIEKRVTLSQDVKSKWIRSLIVGLGYTGIAIVLTFMRIYSIFIYVFSSSLTTALSGIVNGFELKSLVFPFLNLFLFAACTTIYGMASKGFTGAYSNLLDLGSNSTLSIKQQIKKAKTGKLFAVSFIPIIVLSLLSVAAVYVLNIPSFGYGWSVDIFFELVAIFTVATIAQSVQTFFKKASVKQ